MSSPNVRTFGALIDPARTYLIEYARRAGGVEIVDHRSAARGMPTIEEAMESVVELLRPVAAAGQVRLTAAIRGFGISYHLLTLPPAGADVLTPIVEREMSRLFPDISDPLVAFSVGGNIDRRTGRPIASKKGLPDRRSKETGVEVLPLEILAAAAPRHVVDTVVWTLDRAGISLDHLTALPQAMARLYREVNGSPDPAALAILLQGAPVIGVFQGSDVRFIAEPPATEEKLSAVDIQTVIDQVGRARMYMRQHFRGADIGRIFVAADPADYAHVDAVLNAALNVEVVPLAPAVGPPAAIAALGSILNAESDPEMVFHPSPEDLSRNAARRRARGLTMAAGAVCALAFMTAAFSSVAATRAAGELRTERADADARMASIAPAMDVIAGRRANMERLAAIQAHHASRQQLARLINGIRLAQPLNVGVTSASLTRTSDGWRVDLAGTAVGSTGADVLEGVADFSRELPARIPLQSFNMSAFEYGSGEGEMSGSFRISFTVAAVP